MEPTISPEQKRQIDSWVGQRDSILKEIAVAREELEKVLISNKNLSESNTDIADRIQQSIGRLAELEKKEKEFSLLISEENAKLREEKSELQMSNEGLRTENKLLEDRKSSFLRDIENLSGIHDKVFEKVNGLEAIVGGIVSISSENATKINNILISAGLELQRVVDIAEINIEKTNKVILELPKIVVDLHRDVLERKKITKNRTI